MLWSFCILIGNISPSATQWRFRLWKLRTKTPKNLPFPLDYVDPNLIQQCLGPLHAPPQTAATTVKALSHTYAVESPFLTVACPKFAPKRTPYRGPIAKLHHLPHPCTRPTYDAKWHPDQIHCFSTMHWTDRPTDRPWESLTTIGCCTLVCAVQ